jgi:hypothetical protein
MYPQPVVRNKIFKRIPVYGAQEKNGRIITNKLIHRLLLFIVFLQLQSVALLLEPGRVHSFGGTTFIYLGFNLEDSKPFAIIEAYNEDIWHYSIGDTMWLDSAALIVQNINTQNNTADVLLIPEIVGKRDSNLTGARGNGVIIQEKSIVKILNSIDNAITFRVYSTGINKVYSFENDTITIANNKICRIHIYEEGLPIVNCRNIISEDTLIPIKLGYFYLKKSCVNNPLWINGYMQGLEIRVQIEFDDKKTTEYLHFCGNADSTDISINLNESKINPYDSTTMKVEWLFNSSSSGSIVAVGLNIINHNTTSITKSKFQEKNEVSITKYYENGNYNLLGQTFYNTSKKSALIIKNKKKFNLLRNCAP